MYFLRMAGREDTRALSLGSNGGAPVWEDAVGGGVRGTRQCLLAACPRVSAAEGGERG